MLVFFGFRYLLQEKKRGKALDSVANFHLQNGAVCHANFICWDLKHILFSSNVSRHVYANGIKKGPTPVPKCFCGTKICPNPVPTGSRPIRKNCHPYFWDIPYNKMGWCLVRDLIPTGVRYYIYSSWYVIFIFCQTK